MNNSLDSSEQMCLIAGSAPRLPALIVEAGEKAQRRFVEFFTANIRNPNTREAYARAISRFLGWCALRDQQLDTIAPVVVAAYVEQLQEHLARPSVKLHLAALRVFFDWLVVGQIIPFNPASSVRGPTYVVKRGKTPVLAADEARQLLDSINVESIAGLRDRAMIGVMVYSFARISAVVAMRVEDYFQTGKRWHVRLHEKGGKLHEVPCNHNAEAYIDAYIEAAGIGAARKTPLFRSVNRFRHITENPMHRIDALRMIKRRARHVGLPESTCCHTFRATGITVYMENGGTIEKAQQIAAHESPRTTKLYDRSSDTITLDEVERILI